MLACCCVDARDPKRAELALALAAVTVLVLTCLNNCLFGSLEQFRASAVVALRFTENLLVLGLGRYTTFYSCDLSISSGIRQHAAHAFHVRLSDLLGQTKLALTL